MTDATTVTNIETIADHAASEGLAAAEAFVAAQPPSPIEAVETVVLTLTKANYTKLVSLLNYGLSGIVGFLDKEYVDVVNEFKKFL